MSKRITDLTGKRFGKLTVLKLDEERTKAGLAKWICQCDCGNIKSVIGCNLKNGLTQSCGCIQKQKSSRNLIGQRFGKLVVIEKTDKRNSNRSIIWKCKCDCGNVCEVPTGSLIQRKTSSCGCLKNSSGEYEIENLLLQFNIPFEKEKTFENCKSKGKLRFDFYVNNQYLIEFDGVQHYKYDNSGRFDENYVKSIKEHDNIKNQWCKENKIPLIRVPYYKLKTLNIEDLLLDTSTFII